jgi:hypothetical protein
MDAVLRVIAHYIDIDVWRAMLTSSHSLREYALSCTHYFYSVHRSRMSKCWPFIRAIRAKYHASEAADYTSLSPRVENGTRLFTLHRWTLDEMESWRNIQWRTHDTKPRTLWPDPRQPLAAYKGEHCSTNESQIVHIHTIEPPGVHIFIGIYEVLVPSERVRQLYDGTLPTRGQSQQ